MKTLPLLFVIALIALSPRAPAQDLPRKASFPAETYPNLRVEYGVLESAPGVRLRTIVTKPASSSGRIPAVLFVQWLSCDSVELAPTARDGWTLMMRRLVTESGVLVWRTEKPGAGDSGGPACSALDYDTELAQHRAALAALLKRSDVDPARVFIYGASMGTTMAPLVARGQRVKGIITWGGGARSWLERQIAFDRRALELSGRAPAGIAAEMQKRIQFETRYLAGRKTPADVVREQPDLADVAKTTIGLDSSAQYGRPYAFHWQAQAQDWAAAWDSVDAEVLALLGEYDWFEDPRSAELIANIVNAKHPGRARFQLIARTDHHFAGYPDAAAAFHERGGVPDADGAMSVLLPWLRERTK